jgi:hypothetical protein
MSRIFKLSFFKVIKWLIGIIGFLVLLYLSLIELTSKPYHPEGYEITKEKVNYWMCGKEGCFSGEVENADIDTFVIINDKYAKDNKNVYIRSQIVSGADPDTFEVLSWRYSRDKNFGYHYGEKLLDSHGNSFEVISDKTMGWNDYYAKDDQSVYMLGKRIEGADPSSFKILWYVYSQDNYDIYYYENALGADLDTFEFLEGRTYIKDKNAVFFEGERILNADIESFQVLDYPYAIDKNMVYKYGKKMPWIDRSAVEIVEGKFTLPDMNQQEE